MATILQAYAAYTYCDTYKPDSEEIEYGSSFSIKHMLSTHSFNDGLVLSLSWRTPSFDDSPLYGMKKFLCLCVWIWIVIIFHFINIKHFCYNNFNTREINHESRPPKKTSRKYSTFVVHNDRIPNPISNAIHNKAINVSLWITSR